ncbi:MAG: methionyl-tRNA formyltransferase [Candidatus Blackburnbacteria bacterium]|nr:methionyl-tRNA formyltransferase [Candidatus Blackburnbacteria bacterium]
MTKINKFVSRRLEIVFFGTPDYVLPILEVLHQTYRVLAVVTQPPKPVGRQQKMTPSAVSLWAKEHHIPVLTSFTPLHISVKNEVGVLASYGRIIPRDVLEIFPRGIINVHPSLLPKYRGPSPVTAAIAAGERETGVTIIKLDEEMDHGPILAQFTEEIKPDDTTGSLRDRVFKKSAEVLATILPDYLEGRVTPREQNHEQATYTKTIKKEHGSIPGKYLQKVLNGEIIEESFPIPFIKDSSLVPDSSFLERFIRALDPWPGGWTNIKLTSYQVSKLARLKLLKAHVEGEKLVLDQVQLEGKNPVSWQQFVAGHPGYQFA